MFCKETRAKKPKTQKQQQTEQVNGLLKHLSPPPTLADVTVSISIRPRSNQTLLAM